MPPDELLKLGVERLDLPRVVARLVVKRAQERQRQLDERAAEEKARGGTGDDENVRPQASQSGGGNGHGAMAAASASASVAAATGAEDAERPVSFAAFYAVYGRHRPEETDKIRLFRLVKRPGTQWVLPADVTELVWAVSETHVGLEFLRDSEEFLRSYVQTTALRILWALAGAGTQRITLQHWRHSTLVEVLFQLDEEADINLARDYFSYNHFYVVWCIFWELDEDEDSLLQKADLMRYGSYGLSSRVVDRLWTLRRETDKEGMTYADFVCFLLAEEDKQAPAALQYWFHVLDVDGDGYLGSKDMWYFYEELQSRLEAMNEELVTYEEIANEFMDIVKPVRRAVVVPAATRRAPRMPHAARPPTPHAARVLVPQGARRVRPPGARAARARRVCLPRAQAVRGRISLSELKRCGLGYNLVSALTNVSAAEHRSASRQQGVPAVASLADVDAVERAGAQVHCVGGPLVREGGGPRVQLARHTRLGPLCRLGVPPPRGDGGRGQWRRQGGWRRRQRRRG
jgi:Ca2+-binding EF-hand superfamily protein